MSMDNLIRQARSFRRFQEADRIGRDNLLKLVDLARQSPSGGNLQPLRYRIVETTEECAAVFPHTAWAALLKGWDGPATGERPSGYIMILSKGGSDTNVGIAAQTIQLAATEMGYGACMIGSLQRDALKKELAIPDPYEIRLAVALGRPAEQVVIDEISGQDSLAYYRDEQDIHHVPKLGLKDVLIS